jgi:HK97 gp10 family phage protein
MITFKVTGFEEVRRNLKRLQKATQREVALRSLEAGGEVIADEARRLVRVDDGKLRNDISVGRRAEGAGSTGEPTVYVGPTNKTDWRAHFEEFGTEHSAANPFLRPAIDGPAAGRAVQVVGRKLGSEIEKQGRS